MIQKIALSMVLLFSTVAFGSRALMRPDNFMHQGKAAVFVNFTDAHYEIVYDIPTRKNLIRSVIKFEVLENGYPIFDLVDGLRSASLNGSPVQILEVPLPNTKSKVRLVDRLLQVGQHTLVIESENTSLLEFDKQGVRSAFWMSDLDDREFLEQYLPTSFEYDAYQMTFHVKVLGAKVRHRLFVNGTTTELAENEWRVDFPAYYTTSSVFYHLLVSAEFRVLSETLHSIDGRVLPLTVYVRNSVSEAYAKRFLEYSVKYFHILESEFGPWLHQGLIVYGAGSGGMEYCGATVTELAALDHEMMHSYFARGLMPANGDAGWVDEAVTSWRDAKYPTLSQPRFNSSNMGARGVYVRHTDNRAYSLGKNFISFLHKESQSKGGFKAFLNQLLQDNFGHPLTTPTFQTAFETFTGRSYKLEFDQYIYSQSLSDSAAKVQENPYHPKLGKKQLRDLL